MPITVEFVKIASLSVIAFLLALFTTPVLTTFLYKNKIGKQIRSDGTTPVFSKLHARKNGTPTMGGVLVWGTTLFVAGIFWFLDRALGIQDFHGLNFLTRKETWLPLGMFVLASLVGLVDDFLDATRRGHKGRGLRFRFKVLLYAAIGAIGAGWFYYKLGFDAIHLPFIGDLVIGLWFIPFFILAVVGVSFAVNLTDGLDGLAGGTLLVSFFSVGAISILQHKYNLAAFIAVIIGGLLAFLWFNIHPARFFMGDTGSMGMGVILAVVCFLTGTTLLLPFFGFIFMIEALSFFLQLFWRAVFKKKLLLSSPLHHHLEALGWDEPKITMRFWVLSWVASIVGLIIYLIGF